MSAIFFLIFASSLGIMSEKTEILGFEAIYWCMAIMALSYLRYAYKNRKNVKILIKNNTIKWLIVFEIIGAVMVIISFLGYNNILAGTDLIIDKSYIPRQAIYLYFMPAIVVMAEPEYKMLLDKILYKFSMSLFFIIYLYCVVITKHYSLSVSAVFLLIILHLYRQPKNIILNLCIFILLMITPIAVGGEMTNALLRILYAFFFVFQKRKKIVTEFVAAGSLICIIAVFIIPFFSGYIEPHLDANTAWRLNFWNDELIQLVQSKGLGVGFGTSFASPEFVQNQSSILRSPYDPVYRQQTIEYLMMTTGPHNSLISLAFRMGVAGIITFIGFLFSIILKVIKNIKNVSIFSIFAFFAAIVIISVNVGLESPIYLLIFTMAFGMSNYNHL